MTGMAPRIWGPMLWELLHAISRMVDERGGKRNRDNFMTLLVVLQYVLPCVACRENYKRNIVDYLKRDTTHMAELVIDLHNTVNKHLQKPLVDTKTALKRQEVWDVKIDGDKCIGFLYVVMLNYDACGVEDKCTHYFDFLCIMSKLLSGLTKVTTANSKSSVESLGLAIGESIPFSDLNLSSAVLVRNFYNKTVKRWYKITRRDCPTQRRMTVKYNLCKA